MDLNRRVVKIEKDCKILVLKIIFVFLCFDYKYRLVLFQIFIWGEETFLFDIIDKQAFLKDKRIFRFHIFFNFISCVRKKEK